GILAEALQRDAGDDLTLSVHFGDAAPFIGCQLNPRDILEQHRHTAVTLDHDLFEVGQALDVTAPAYSELGFSELDGAPTHVHIAGPQGFANSGKRNAKSLQAAWIDYHAVLLDEAANARDLGNPFGLGDAVAHIPVLNGAQLGEALLRAAHDILEHPADAGGIGPETWRHARWQPPCR